MEVSGWRLRTETQLRRRRRKEEEEKHFYLPREFCYRCGCPFIASGSNATRTCTAVAPVTI